jgi:hypothetical protein
MANKHGRYHFSATCGTDDSAVVHCLRALCEWAERGESPQIGWGGSTEKEWKGQGQQITLRFSNPDLRRKWQEKATELLHGRWSLVRTDDEDPALQRRAARSGEYE